MIDREGEEDGERVEQLNETERVPRRVKCSRVSWDYNRRHITNRTENRILSACSSYDSYLVLYISFRPLLRYVPANFLLRR